MLVRLEFGRPLEVSESGTSSLRCATHQRVLNLPATFKVRGGCTIEEDWCTTTVQREVDSRSCFFSSAEVAPYNTTVTDLHVARRGDAQDLGTIYTAASYGGTVD